MPAQGTRAAGQLNNPNHKSAEEAAIGACNIVIRRRGSIGIDANCLDCDYYRFLQGDIRTVNAFQGEYMKQYSWAEATLGKILFRVEKSANLSRL